mmetsp:Transcript_14688/g.17621  ORF Transcript_14688/g.17621 Transcript_14688/m.17621 type:complete len:81 (+) Transcript_14688:205-447(+)
MLPGSAKVHPKRQAAKSTKPRAQMPTVPHGNDRHQSARKEVRLAAHSRAKVAPLIRPRGQKPAATNHDLKHWGPLWRTLE